jgi:poly(3-hydroxybutyrate) depolymerase
MAKTYLALIPAALLALMAACGSDGLPGSPSVGDVSKAGSTGAAGAAGASPVGAAGANPSAGAAPIAGAGPGAAGASGASGAGPTAGAGGAPATAGAGGMSGGSAGAAGTPGKVRSGPSAGCGKNAPGDDSTTKFVKHEVHMTGIAARYLPGGADYKKSDVYDYTFRPYSVRLPKNYDPNTKYAVTFGGGGCGGTAQNFAKSPGDSFSFAPDGTTIHIGMSMVDGCFEDDGVDNAEVPYFRAIMADIEQKYCFDLSKVFVGGYSSGGWEAYQMGCAASDLVRGFGADEGALRAQHPPCKNPIAAVMVAGEADTINPIGPLDPTTGKGKELDSYGSGPSRDEILMRNGCVGTATAPIADPKYPACKQYTGCPAAYPVVWCSLPGVGHNNSTYNGTNYSPGPMWGILGSLPAP